MVDKGVVWKVGKVFLGAQMLYQFDLLPEDGHKMPAFINLQQYYAEAYLVDRVGELPDIDLRWRNKVIGLKQHNDHAVLEIETPDGPYRLCAQYVVACDGARSGLRGMVGAEFSGEMFEDQFLIADVKMTRGISDRALVLVRSAVSCRAIGAAASPARQCLAHRSAAWSRRRPRGGTTAGKCSAAHRTHAGPWQFRVRMDFDL